jgi:hypothetical protein
MSLFNSRQACFCAFCGQKRMIYRLRRANLTHFMLSLLISIMFMWSIWQSVEPRGILIFIIVQVFIEVVVHFRWRLSVTCRHCGFDPVIYLKDHNRAAEKVKNYLERRKVDPRFLLSPALNLARKPVVKSQIFNGSKSGLPAQNSNKGRIVSKSV